MLNPSMVNGVEQMRLRAKTQSEAESQYFLLIMKQSSSEGLYTKFFVEIKLPTVGVFACLSNSKQKLLAEKIRLEMEKEYNKTNRVPYLYAQAESRGMEVMKNTIEQIVQGNCCVMTPEEIRNMFREKSFAAVPVEIQPPSATKPEKIQARSNNYIVDYANLTILANGTPYDIENNFNIGYFDFLNSQGKTSKIFVTKNSNFCDSLTSIYSEITSEFASSSHIFTGWYHIWENPNPAKPDTLYSMIKVSRPQFEGITGTFQGTSTYEGCTSAQNTSIDSDVSFATTMLDTAIAKLSRYNGINPPEVKTALNNNFGGSTSTFFADWIKLNINILRGMGPWAGYDCIPTDPDWCPGTTLAYTIWCVPLFDVRLCPEYFAEPQIERSGTLIHEWVHKYGCNFDLGYDWEPDYPKNSTLEQLINADSFSEFVKDVW
jgi:hypothetical protein